MTKELNKAEKIDIYGSCITESCANAAMFKFQSIGKECSVYSAINEHYIMSVKNRKITAILLSFTGGNSGMVHIAKCLKKCGIYTLGIGGIESDELKKQCSEYIEVYQKNLVMSLEMLMPYISMTYIFDVLFASLLVKDFDCHLNNAIDVMKMKK
ncbi:MurR/RpiR family transcriptional regulator [uncultured Clostridium sp.]|uniref:MurR/RpiR family transcriptional regulator n=1 Tax=uncultured Clostridium sp. TaxID=59620 RepID=UPI0025D887F6|nr:SIS domain-containing protein [uncultured Clostridium sp.]